MPDHLALFSIAVSCMTMVFAAAETLNSEEASFFAASTDTAFWRLIMRFMSVFALDLTAAAITVSMSERIYAWLLRLYPSHFRKAYGDEALQLFRDRARDERGFLSGMRLWLDLLGDLAISVPREYRHNPRVVVASLARHCSDGTLSFHILEDKALSFGSLLYGGVVSLVVYGSVLFVMGHGKSHFTFANSGFRPRPGYAATTAKATPTVVFSYLRTNPTAGSTLSFTATVTGVDDRPTPTGSVRFLYGYTLLKTGTLNNGVVTVNGKVPNPKTRPFSARYLGDLNYKSALQIEQK